MIITINHNKKRITVLLNKKGMPYPLLLIYSTYKLWNNASSTNRKKIRAISEMYTYLLKVGIEPENEFIIKNNLGNYKILGNYLYELQIQTKDFEIRTIKQYIQYSFYKYGNSKLEKKLKLYLESFSVLKRSISKNQEYYSLSETEINTLFKILKDQFYIKQISKNYRDYLIFTILEQTGLRIGELLTLTVDDIIRIQNRFYISVCKSNFTNDTRSTTPSIKNNYSLRNIAISTDLNRAIETYIKSYRRNSNKKLETNFLLLNQNNKPLSARSVQKMFNELRVKYINLVGLELNCTAHSLRHTFADRFLKYLSSSKFKNIDNDTKFDQLRSICGWAPNSLMPLRYSSREVNRQANIINIKRIESK